MSGDQAEGAVRDLMAALERSLAEAKSALAPKEHACCKRHVPGPVFTQFEGDPAPEFICPECGSRWVWDDDEAEGGAWYWDPENDRNDDGVQS